jgi:hypothetical protein
VLGDLGLFDITELEPSPRLGPRLVPIQPDESTQPTPGPAADHTGIRIPHGKHMTDESAILQRAQRTPHEGHSLFLIESTAKLEPTRDSLRSLPHSAL